MLLELREKVEGALGTLLAHATYDAFRLEHIRTPVSDVGALTVLLIRQFLISVSSYVSHGRQFNYQLRRRTGVVVGGRIDVTRSLQLRARGLGHRFVFEKNVISYATTVNRIVLAALRMVGRLDHVVTVPAEDVARARGLALLFSDCTDAEIVFGQSASLIDQAGSLLDSGQSGKVRDMIALARVILSHEGFESSVRAGSVPRSWFLNLESLFEAAVRNLVREFAGNTHVVSTGARHARRVFPRVPDRYAAHPDLVMTRDRAVEAIGDVKYKAWDGKPTASDVYQLLVHATAFECQNAFLVFPGDRFEVRHLGEAATGCQVTFFAVNVRNLRQDVESLVAQLHAQ